MSMWHFLILLLACTEATGTTIAAEVSTQEQFLLALKDQKVQLIVLLGDIALQSGSALWQGTSVVRVTRDLTISGSLQQTPVSTSETAARTAAATGQQHLPGAQQPQRLVALDLSYMRNKVELAPNILITFQLLEIKNSYTEWVPGVHFLQYAPNVKVRLHHAVRPLPSCPRDLEWLRQVVQGHQLPPGYVAPQHIAARISTVEHGSSSDTAQSITSTVSASTTHSSSHAGQEPFSNLLTVMNLTQCQQQWPYPDSCSNAGVLISRLAYEVPRQPDRRWAHAFVGIDEAFDSYYPCASTIKEECLQQHGYPECFTRHAAWAARMAFWKENWGKLCVGLFAAIACVILSFGWWLQQRSSVTVGVPTQTPAAAPVAKASCADDEGLSATQHSIGSNASAAAAPAVPAVPLSPAAAVGKSYGSEADSDTGEDQLAGLTLGALVGVGSFGRVYRGDWAGLPVAVKVMEVQGYYDKKSVRHELAVNKLLHHPNVVQCLAYRMQQLEGNHTADAESKDGNHPTDASVHVLGSHTASADGSSSASREQEQQLQEQHAEQRRSWTQVLLLLEYCNRGSLHDAILDGIMRSAVGAQRTNYSNMVAVLRIALDIARGMAHIHSRNVCHGDLCSKNVLLVSSLEAPPPLRVVAKVADFGLSRLLPHQGTHLSTLTQGTLTHMAPEVLLTHQLRPAADVYSYGVLLWELVHLGSIVPGLQPSTPTDSTSIPCAAGSTCSTAAGSSAAVGSSTGSPVVVQPYTASSSNSRGSEAPAGNAAGAAEAVGSTAGVVPLQAIPAADKLAVPSVGQSSKAGLDCCSEASTAHTAAPSYAATVGDTASLLQAGIELETTPRCNGINSPTASAAATAAAAAASPSVAATAAPSAAASPVICTRVYHHLGSIVSPWAIMQHVIQGGRPVFSAPAVPTPYIRLAQSCWHAEPDQRPTFDEIVELLEAVVLDTGGLSDRADLVGSF